VCQAKKGAVSRPPRHSAATQHNSVSHAFPVAIAFELGISNVGDGRRGRIKFFDDAVGGAMQHRVVGDELVALPRFALRTEGPIGLVEDFPGIHHILVTSDKSPDESFPPGGVGR